MSQPISPKPVSSHGEKELPAYVSNGLIGLRVRDIPLLAGMALVSGFAGEHPERRVEAAATAPYPPAGDLAVDGVWMSDVFHQTCDLEQTYDFRAGELMSHFTLKASGVATTCEVLTFASREDPTLVCQEMSLIPSNDCDVQVKAMLDGAGIAGRALRHIRDTPGESKPACDGTLLWESPGGLGVVGFAYVTGMLGGGACEAEPKRPPLANNRLETAYSFRAQAGQRYQLQQVTSVVCGVMHHQPDHHAARMVAKARSDGFDTLRAENRAAWVELWKGRIRLIGADERWQALADAAFFYLHSSVHSSSPASTSIFGLATWHDYHYYYGHVMWDIEAFAVPVLSLQQPGAAEAILDYRTRTLKSARHNASLMGRRGVQFTWESAPSTGDEAAPVSGTAAWHEDHVSLDVARAFAFHADVCGERDFKQDKAWPVLSGVAEWIASRIAKTGRGYEVRASMGIAERERPVDNAAFTNMACVVVLRDAIAAAEDLGRHVDPKWTAISDGMVLPRRGRAVISHDGYRRDEEKGATPDPLMGIWPFGFLLDEADEAATLSLYLDQAQDYIGSPMLSALYGVWVTGFGSAASRRNLLLNRVSGRGWNHNNSGEKEASTMESLAWWQKAIIYQIYPRSFFDGTVWRSEGDPDPTQTTTPLSAKAARLSKRPLLWPELQPSEQFPALFFASPCSHHRALSLPLQRPFSKRAAKVWMQHIAILKVVSERASLGRHQADAWPSPDETDMRLSRSCQHAINVEVCVL